MDFMKVAYKSTKSGFEVYPKFIIKKHKDLMIRGGDFYAIWDEENGVWSTDEGDAIRLIDKEIDKYCESHKEFLGSNVKKMYMWDSDTNQIDKWHKYVQKQQRDSYQNLDETLIFSNTERKKENYSSKSLTYPLENGECPSYEKIMSVLYSPEERMKLEWAIGSIVTGDSKKLQKFLVLYGSAGTGKSTVLNIIEKLFDGYYAVFDAKALGQSNASFALEPFKNNPLVAIQHDGDLSRIEDNTRLNSLVSHELMTVNEKFKGLYSNRFKCFLFMGTNKPVKITDAKSGLIRRLIDVTPSGDKLPTREYNRCMKNIDFELGAIANHCKEVYLSDPNRYDGYIPVSMMGASNDFYNYVVDMYSVFLKEDGVTAKIAWERYKQYCDDAKVTYPFSYRVFKEELKNYFNEYLERYVTADGQRVRSYYNGFKIEVFENDLPSQSTKEKNDDWIVLKEQPSNLDKMCKDELAQYASSKETPTSKWENVDATLADLDSSRLHYVKLPENHIVIDFDIKENGKKSLVKNLEEANKFPPTYAEVSKGGNGLHLHYIYKGDVNRLKRLYKEDIEIKVFNGNSSLRRKLSKCNSLDVATISSGLPVKEAKVVQENTLKTEKALRDLLIRNLNKEIHPGTKPSVDFIKKILDDAYDSGMKYDVSDMRNAIFMFAAGSSHQATTCIKMVNEMKFKSETASDNVDSDRPIVFYDIEVFPNLLLVNWKIRGEDNPIVRMINPKPEQIEDLIKYRLVGFNCRRYDNHILYARLMGYSIEQLYDLSKKIISSQKGDRNNGLFGEAYNLSYTDVYDFASAGNKMSLKKLEIKMGIHHKELGFPWDEPVPEEKWVEVAEYCDNDVIATEAAFEYLSADWTARQILADLAGMTVNDTTNTLTTKIIFGGNRNPQNESCYRNLAEPVHDLEEEVYEFLAEACPVMMSQTHGEDGSLLPYFPGYKFECGKSTYKGEVVGEGGYVYAEPGMYGDVALLDVSSMHPHSTIAECLFGVRYTKSYRDVVEGRVSIKHEAWEEVNGMLDGKLSPYVQRVKDGEMTSKDLADALKTAINSVYGLTSAHFNNPFKDPRNIDNIVAKRGALFMIDLKEEVQKRGFTVAHIKTDSIKIPDATPEIIKFVMEFGEKYGYTFEHEATYEKLCLVNDAVYIAKDKADGHWTATGKQFAVPYVFKTLFSKEDIVFDDMCETFAVSKGDLYLDINENLPDVTLLEKELDKLESKYKKGLISDSTFEPESIRLTEEIEAGHDLHFVGRVGRFTPIKDGYGGGVLYRVNDGKKYAAPGSKGYRWVESELVTREDFSKDLKECIDIRFYEDLVDDAVKTISEYGDFEWFVSDDPYVKDFVSVPPTSPKWVPFN